MNSGEEDLDPEVIGNIVQQVVAQLSGTGHQHHGGSTQSSRRVVRREIHREIHGLGFGPSSNAILQSGGPSGQNFEINWFMDLLLQVSVSQNQHAEAVNRRLERKDQEIDQLKTESSSLKEKVERLEAENSALKEKVEHLEATVFRMHSSKKT